MGVLLIDKIAIGMVNKGQDRPPQVAASANSIPESTNVRGKRDYKIGYGKPPRGRPFQKGQSGNPRGPRRKEMSSLLIAALNEPVYATIDAGSCLLCLPRSANNGARSFLRSFHCRHRFSKVDPITRLRSRALHRLSSKMI